MEAILPLASAIAKRINLRFLNPAFSELIIAGLLLQLRDIVLRRYSVDISEYLVTTNTINESVTEVDLEVVKEDLVTILNKEINIPVLIESTEEKLFDAVLSVVQEYVLKEKTVLLN